MQRQVFMTEREVETVERKDEIVSGKTFLGIEFGSTLQHIVFDFLIGCLQLGTGGIQLIQV